MQLTRFDRWLREKFVYETHIHTLRPPETLPPGIRVVDVPEAPGKRYKHKFVTRSSKAADALIRQLKEAGQMYTTQIVDCDSWFVSFIAPKNKSFTWRIISSVMITISVITVLMYVKTLADNPEFRKNFLDALQLLKG